MLVQKISELKQEYFIVTFHREEEKKHYKVSEMERLIVWLPLMLLQEDSILIMLIWLYSLIRLRILMIMFIEVEGQVELEMKVFVLL